MQNFCAKFPLPGAPGQHDPHVYVELPGLRVHPGAWQKETRALEVSWNLGSGDKGQLHIYWSAMTLGASPGLRGGDSMGWGRLELEVLTREPTALTACGVRVAFPSERAG